MVFIDIILGLLLIWGLWKGLKNGLFVEIASIIALVAGIYGAVHFSYITGNYLAAKMEWDAGYINITAFIITFILIVLIVHMAGKFLTKIADFAMLGLLNKIAGGIFGVLKVAVILGTIIIFFEKINANLNFMDEETKKTSTLYPPIKEIGGFVFDTVLKVDEREPENR
ncbi:CvpA family protein [Maribacter sp. 2304DJ31-5]|uniref:CvpA family protein n=1 Tax=Maribacter sp. 2304DJ31-5 TaxID=3386273 RepID=UPI0039BCB4E7